MNNIETLQTQLDLLVDKPELLKRVRTTKSGGMEGVLAKLQGKIERVRGRLRASQKVEAVGAHQNREEVGNPLASQGSVAEQLAAIKSSVEGTEAAVSVRGRLTNLPNLQEQGDADGKSLQNRIK